MSSLLLIILNKHLRKQKSFVSNFPPTIDNQS